MSRFHFVADHLHAFEVKWLCAVVEVARSSFYAWLAGAEGRAARRATDQALAERIRAVHNEDNTYGAPRITAELNDGVPEAQRVNHKRVARVMRTNADRRLPAPPAGHDHHAGSGQPDGPRPAQAGLHRHADQHPLRRGHHLLLQP